MKFETAKPLLNLANAVLEGDFAGVLNLLMQNQLLGCAALATLSPINNGFLCRPLELGRH